MITIKINIFSEKKVGVMCSRFGTGKAAQEWIRKYGWSSPTTDGDCSPNDTVPALISQGGRIIAVPMMWGMENPKNHSLIINARIETADQKAMFSDSLLRRRCILPAEKFYEWNAEKRKATFCPAGNDSLLFLCGIYTWDGATPRFVILTKEADEVMKPVHDRMPVMVKEKDISRWLTDYMAMMDISKKGVPLNRIEKFEQLSLFEGV